MGASIMEALLGVGKPKLVIARIGYPPSSLLTCLPQDMPVAHRATLRLVRDLGLLGPKDKMTPKAAKALIKKFDEPLTGEDIEGLAKLTYLERAALRVAAGLAGPDGAPLGDVV